MNNHLYNLNFVREVCFDLAWDILRSNRLDQVG